MKSGMHSTRSRRFWLHLKENSLEIDKWPQWKLDAVKIKKLTPEEKRKIKAKIKEIKRIQKLCEKPCSSAATFKGTKDPTCRYGYGCDPCWYIRDKYLDSLPDGY